MNMRAIILCLVYMITLYGKSEDPREFINPRGLCKKCAVLSVVPRTIIIMINRILMTLLCNARCINTCTVNPLLNKLLKESQ